MGGNRIDRFITRWHRGEWSISNLPPEIGARVGYFQFDTRLLGCCDVRHEGVSVIGLNASLVGTNCLVPVLAHECAHVLLGRQGYHACGISGGNYSTDYSESRVWKLAGRLCLPEAVRESVLDGTACCDGVARAYGLPVSFVSFAVFGEALLPAWLRELGTA